MKLLIPYFTLILLSFTSKAPAQTWSSGVAQTVITPDQPLWMAGYGSRKTPAEGKTTDLFGKALVIDSGETRAVIITLDLVGIDRGFSRDLCKRLEEKYQLKRPQIALATSHTHSGPVVGGNLAPLHYYRLSEDQQKMIDAYTEKLKGKLVDLVGAAIQDLKPTILQTGNGRASFAVNRRENKPYGAVEQMRFKGSLKGPVDHDVPVLTVRDEAGVLRAVLFGYACHSTVLSAMQWNGDYPGYAQAALEIEYPGTVALFWAGCGGDQNPLPRSTVELAEKYGNDLARAVSDVIRAPMPQLEVSLDVHYKEIDAPLAELPTMEQVRANQTNKNVFEVARAKYLLKQFKERGQLDQHYPYPVGYWKLGKKIDFVFLGGEVVVDYANRIKREVTGSSTWVAAYANDVMAYIPSLRVLKEGGYEGGGSNVYYGLPTLWSEQIEETIVKEVHNLVKESR